MAKINIARAEEFKKLFLAEEFKGEKLINYVRFFLIFVFLFLALAKSNLFSGLIVTNALSVTLIILGSALIYTVLLLFLYRLNIYHPFIKYISVTIDMTLIVMAIFVYKLEPYHEYAMIFFLARYSIVFIFIILSIMRYNFWISVYAGCITAIEYYLLVVRDNFMTGLSFTFTGSDGITYSSAFAASELILKIIYLLLAGLVAGIISVKLRNIVVSSVTREQEKNTLASKNQLIDAVNHENKKYLDNLSDGLLLVGKDMVIHDQYSRYLTLLFETSDIAGKNIIDFLYPQAGGHEEERKELENFIRILFSNITADLTMIMDVNPLAEKSIAVKTKDGTVKEKVITTSFYRVYQGKQIEDIMVIFKDITALTKTRRELKEEKIRHESEIEVIAVILKIGPRTLLEFLKDEDSALGDVELNLDKMETPFILDEIFRHMHSLKGSARSLGFRSISDEAHKIEELLSQVRDRKVPVDYNLKTQIRSMISSIFVQFGLIKELHEKFRHFSEQAPAAGQESETALLDSFISSLKEMTLNLGKELEKELNLQVSHTLTRFPLLPVMRNSIIHLLRNAIDHGIEDRFERLAAGKGEQGTIRLTLSANDKHYLVEVSDDGKGIDFEKVKLKALEKGLLKAGDGEVPRTKLLSFLFMPAFSSRDKVTDLSGRGVGLDIVKDTMNKLGGKIAVSSAAGKGTKFLLTIPLHSQ